MRSTRMVRRSTALTALLAVTMLSGCTGSSTSAASSPIPGSATSTAQNPTRNTVTNPPGGTDISPSTVPDAGTSPGSGSATGTPSAGTGPTIPAPDTSTTPTSPAATAFPGLYGLDRFGPDTRGMTVSFSTATACTDVLATLAAGQWALTVLNTPTDVPEQLRNLMPWYLVSMTKGPESAYLKLIEGEYSCDGTLIRSTEHKLTLAGAETLGGAARFTPFQCGPNPFDRESVMMTGFYDTDQVHLLVNLTFPAQDGTHDVDAADEVGSVQVVHGAGSMLERYGAAFASLALTENDDSDAVPGSTVFHADENTRMSVTATSVYPLDGTVQLTGLRSETGQQLELSAGFHCDTTPLPPPAEDEDAENAAPAAPLDGDEPASTDGEGTVTVTVSSGPRQGTHTGTGSLKCHHHQFGPDSWWLIFSSDSEDPDAVTLLNLWSQPKDEVGEKSVYPEPFLVDVGFGVFVLNKDLQLHINADVGGTGEKVAVHGSTVTATATTADQVTLTITAECG